MPSKFILKAIQKTMRTAAASSGQKCTLSCWPCVYPSCLTYIFKDSFKFMSYSFSVDKNVLFKLGDTLLEPKNILLLLLFHASSLSPRFLKQFVKMVDAQTLTYLPCCLPAAKISKAIVTLLNLRGLDHVRSQIILCAVFQASFRKKTASHLNKLVVPR